MESRQRDFVDEKSKQGAFSLSALREHWFFAVVPYFSNPQLNPQNALSCKTRAAFGGPRVFVSGYKICSRSVLTSRPRILLPPSNGSSHISGQGSGIDFGQCIFRLHAFQVDHRRFNVPVPHPVLQGADVNAMSQVLCREGVPKLMQEEMLAVRPF
jgi:hypothetical protein